MSIFSKTLFVLILTLSIFAASSIYIVTKALQENADEGERAWLSTLTQVLSEGLANDLLRGNIATVREKVESIVGQNTQVGYIFVTGLNGEILLHTFLDGFPRKLLSVLQGKSPTEIETKLILDGKNIKNISYPVLKGLPMRIHIGIDNSVLSARKQETVQKTFAVLSFVFLLAILIASVMSRSISRSLKILTSGMSEYASNRTHQPVIKNVKVAELDKLVNSFNQMVQERTAAERELEEHRENLEALVEQRTMELVSLHQKLLVNERLATLGQLTATVSHELRNPLGAMRPSLYIFKLKIGDDDKLLKAYQRLERGINRCDKIIDELLDFTRITDLDIHDTMLEQWIDGVIDELSIPTQIKLHRDYHANIKFWADTDRLRRVIINIIENAWQAIEERSSEESSDNFITVTTQLDDDRLEIIIEDSGVGMNDEVLGRLFEPLYSTKGFGVGLGMPTVKQIMEQHKGGIDVTSKQGEGTRVTLWLPATCIIKKEERNRPALQNSNDTHMA